MAISPIARMSGDDAVVAATGRRAEEWFALLDAAGAAQWPHPRIARWLADEQGVPSWWRQNLAVRYEQSIGRREPGQKADGTFSVSSSRSVRDDASERASTAFDAVVVAASAELEVEPRSRRQHGLRPNARWTLPTGESVLVAGEPSPGRLRISVTFGKLADSTATATAKERAARILAAALEG